MNEQIQRISEQAEKYADDNFRGEPTWSEAFESKFAELIVLECASIADSAEPFLSSDLIKQHFGVEE
jgi:hypothetical protein